VDLEYFHATEDRQVVRNRVFSVIEKIGGFEFDSVIVDKHRTDPALREDVRFYPYFASFLLQRVFERYTDADERIVVITDRLPMKRRRSAVEKAFKSFMKQRLGAREYALVHHSSASHPCLQAADYCTWAIYKKWSASEVRPYEIIRRFLKSEVDVLGSGARRVER
jgi:hypothetical protein